jgi:hypothetical protein
MIRADDPPIPGHAVPEEVDPVARRSTDQIDPYALIERAERLLNTEPHDAVVFALRAQSVARARTADGLMARAHSLQIGADAGRRLVGCDSPVVTGGAGLSRAGRHRRPVPRHHALASACCELGEYGGAGRLRAGAEAGAAAQRSRRRAVRRSSVERTRCWDFEAARESLRSALELRQLGRRRRARRPAFGMVDSSEGLALHWPAMRRP